MTRKSSLFLKRRSFSVLWPTVRHFLRLTLARDRKAELAVGSLTVKPLILAGVDVCLLDTISRPSTSPPAREFQTDAHIVHVARALRNLLVSTADLMWGSVWGIGGEKKVVSTGIRSDGTVVNAEREREARVTGKDRDWRRLAHKALKAPFEVSCSVQSRWETVAEQLRVLALITS